MRKQTYNIRSNLTVTQNGVVLPKLPSVNDINIGEIAINYKDGYETISIKNDNNEIVTFATLELLINYIENLKLSSLYAPSENSNEDLALEPGDTYEEAFSKLEKAIIDNEETTAAALNDLNSRVESSSLSDEYAAAELGTPPVAGDTYEEAISKLHKVTVDNELVTARALTDLNTRLSEYDKAPLIIEVNDTDATVPSGTYASITAALAAGREVVVNVTLTDNADQVLYLHIFEDDSTEDTYYFSGICLDEPYSYAIFSDDSSRFNFVNLYTIFAQLEHTHGNITNDGKLQTSDISIASGDKLVVTDSSDSSKIARASLSFDGSTTTKALTPKGTWETFLKTAPVTSVNGQTGDVEVVIPQSLLLKGITPQGHTLADAADSYYANELNNGEAGAWFISYSNGDILVKSSDTSKDQDGRVCLSSSWKSRLNYGGMTWANVGDILLVYKQSSLIVVYKVMSINEAGETRIGLMSPNDKIQVNKISNIEGNVNNLLGKIDKRLPYSTDSTNIGNAGNGAYTNVTAGRTNWLDTSTAGAAIKLGNLQIAIDNSGRLYSRNQTNNIWNVTNQLKNITETDLNNVFEPSVIGYATVTNGPSETGNYTVYTFTSSDYDGNGFRSILQIAINRNSGNQYMRTCFKKVDGSGTDFTSTDWKLVSPSVTSVNGQTGAVTLSIPNDSNLVHKTGNETISGTKSFGGENADLDLNIGGTSANIVLSAGVPADALSGGEFGWISVTGKNNTGKTLQQALDERNNVQADWNQTTTTAKDYIKNKPNITKTSNGNWDFLNINEEIINLNTSYAAYYNNKEIAVKDDIPSEIITGQVVGRMHRDNVSGTGNLTIAGASGEGFSPNGITTAGKYMVVVYSWSDTKTFGYNISFGSNSYTLSTTDGTISDKRELTVSAGALWSGSVTTAVSAGTTIIVEIYKAEKTTPALSVGTVALTNLYNDLDGKPTISDSTSSTSSTDIASSKAVKLAYDHGGVQSVNGQTGNVNLALGDTNVIESISVNGVAQTVTNKNVDITVSADITVDSELDPESTNPVENQAIFNELKVLRINNNGHEYVDLGLPSGTLWATVNIGASSESSPGYIREWGETTEEYTPFHDNKYYSNGSYTKYNTTDNLTTLEPEDDAAVVYWGGDWRMPTQTEAQELIDECTWTQERVNGQLGARVTGTNGNSIFMPYDTFWQDGTEYTAYGSIWTSTVGASNLSILNAKLLFYFLGAGASIEVSSYARKRSGAAIRPVIKESYLDRYVKVDDSSYEVTYAELKQLRDTNQLIPGKYYRIIDYVTTADGIDNSEIVSACHPFDIIVRADGANTLNENAYAAVHAGDTYFANSNLAAWKLKYTIDRGDFTGCPINDYSYKAMICKYLDSSNNPHYYLYMYDSVGNLFILYYFNDETFTKVSNYGTVIDLRCAHFNINANTYYDYIESTNPNSITIGDTVIDFNNVSYEVVDIAEIKYEFKGWIYYMKDENENECSYDFKNILFNVPGSSKLLDKSDYLDLEEIYYTFNYDNKDASLGGNYDKYSPSVFNNKIAVTSGIMYNVFRCTSSRGTTISYNILDEECSECIFRDTGSGIRGRINNNHIGKKCNNIIVNGGKTTAYICDNCNNITLGNNNDTIIIQLNCNNITFGTSEGTKNYYRNIIIEPGNQYIYLNNTQTTSSSNLCQNIKICSGVNNTTTWKQIDVGVVGNQYQIEYKSENSKTITV